MKHTATHTLRFLAATMAATTLLSACKKEPLVIPEPEVRQQTNRYTNDSTGTTLTDSITVVFGEKRWSTLDYTVSIDTLDSPTGLPFEWVTIEAHHPDGRLPKLRLIVLKEVGSNSARLSVADPGVGYTVPGEMYRGAKGGDLYYCDSVELHQPDGTRWPDWRPLELTTTVLDFDNYYHTLTATASGLLFHFGQWLDSVGSGHPIDVAAADTCRISIAFGNLKLNQ